MNNNLKQDIKTKKIEILYRHANTVIISTLILAVFISTFVYFVIWPENKPVDPLFIWLIMYITVSVIRLYGISLYKKSSTDPEQTNYRLYVYLSGAVVSGCLWGMFFLYMVSLLDITNINILIFLMMGMISAAVAAYATSLLTFSIASFILACPVIVYFLLHTDVIFNYMGYLLIIYMVFLFIICRQLNKTVEEFLKHEFDISRLEREKRYAAMLNRELEEEIIKRIHTEGKLKAEKNKAEALADKLITISSKDGLTGINNRRHFDEYLENEWNRSARSATPLSLIFCDIDFYKAYNDTYGHLAGDDCLKKIAHVLEHYARRAGDMAARYGGEEFAIILPETSSSMADHIAEEIRMAVEDLQIIHNASEVSDHVTVSLGVATQIPTRHNKPHDLINLADEAMYEAKHKGRNQVIVANPGDTSHETLPVES
jgi:diguanylate cyclase (GGDEF)-like protein